MTFKMASTSNCPLCLAIVSLLAFVSSTTIEVAECDPPDYPKWGGYGPRQDFYVVGDVIHYYCDTDTYIGGNFLRICEDNGDWTGDTPVCDESVEFSSVNQTSTASPADENDAERVTDGLKTTCSSTKNGNNEYWMALLKETGEMIRVMVFMPIGEVSYEVLLLKPHGQDLSCGRKIGRKEKLGWEFHNCPGPHNQNAIGVKIRALSPIPLQICDVAVHVLTPPTCTDPHLQLENGRVQLSRKTAALVCDKGYTRSPQSQVDCVRTGVWSRKSMYCLGKEWEVGHVAENPPDYDP